MSGGLHLLTPGLLGPLPATGQDMIVQELARRPVHLERLLARADRVAGADGPMQALFAAFAVAAPADRDLPSAPFCRLADAPDEDDGGYWLHADPVHLRPDRDRVRLFDPQSLDINATEAAELIALLNGHFGPDGLRWIAPHPHRWYLHLDKAPALRTTPITQVVGQVVEPFLPTGDDARRWGALLNEVQMLLHGAAVNQRREHARRPMINGLWLWGGGSLSSRPTAPPFSAIHAAAPLAIGLGRWSGAPVERPSAAQGLPPRIAEALIGTRLIHWEAPERARLAEDLGAWGDALRALDAWLGEHALPALGRRGQVTSVILDPGLGTRYRLNRPAARRFWRPRKPLVHQLR